MGQKFHWGNGIKGVCRGRAWCSLGWKIFPNIKPFSSMECSSGGIWRWSLRCIKKLIFNEIFTQGCNYQGVVRGKEVPPALFWKLKTSALILKKICPDCVQLWLKFLIENALLRFSNIFTWGAFLSCAVVEMFIEMLLFQETTAALKISWLCPCHTWWEFYSSVYQEGWLHVTTERTPHYMFRVQRWIQSCFQEK